MIALPNPFLTSAASFPAAAESAGASTLVRSDADAPAGPISPGVLTAPQNSAEREPSAMLACVPGESSSDGDSAEKQTRNAGNMPGSVPGEELTASATSFEWVLAWDATTPHQAGVASGPSEPLGAARTDVLQTVVATVSASSETDCIGEIFYHARKLLAEDNRRAEDFVDLAALEQALAEPLPLFVRDGEHLRRWA